MGDAPQHVRYDGQLYTRITSGLNGECHACRGPYRRGDPVYRRTSNVQGWRNRLCADCGRKVAGATR